MATLVGANKPNLNVDANPYSKVPTSNDSSPCTADTHTHTTELRFLRNELPKQSWTARKQKIAKGMVPLN